MEITNRTSHGFNGLFRMSFLGHWGAQKIPKYSSTKGAMNCSLCIYIYIIISKECPYFIGIHTKESIGICST